MPRTGVQHADTQMHTDHHAGIGRRDATVADIAYQKSAEGYRRTSCGQEQMEMRALHLTELVLSTKACQSELTPFGITGFQHVESFHNHQRPHGKATERQYLSAPDQRRECDTPEMGRKHVEKI